MKEEIDHRVNNEKRKTMGMTRELKKYGRNRYTGGGPLTGTPCLEKTYRMNNLVRSAKVIVS